MRFAKVGGSRWSRLVLVGVLLSSFGCVTKIPPSGGGGSLGSLSMYDLESATKSLMSKMLGHPRFKKEYEIAKSANNGKSPVVRIGELRSRLEGEHVQSHLNLVGDMILDALYDSDLFNLDGEAMELDPDFTVKGTIARPVGEVDYYLNIELHSKNGELSNGCLWRDTQKLVKSRK